MTHVFQIFLILIFFTAGHVVRDGYPATGSTFLARLFGALLCGIAATEVSMSLQAGLVIAVLVYWGFVCDLCHAAGQRARGIQDVPYQLISGATSVVWLAAFCVWMTESWRSVELMGVMAIAKVVIWNLAKLIHGESTSQPTYTQIAAGAFGLTLGAILAPSLLHDDWPHVFADIAGRAQETWGWARSLV